MELHDHGHDGPTRRHSSAGPAQEPRSATRRLSGHTAAPPSCRQHDHDTRTHTDHRLGRRTSCRARCPSVGLSRSPGALAAPLLTAGPGWGCAAAGRCAGASPCPPQSGASGRAGTEPLSAASAGGRQRSNVRVTSIGRDPRGGVLGDGGLRAHLMVGLDLTQVLHAEVRGLRALCRLLQHQHLNGKQSFAVGTWGREWWSHSSSLCGTGLGQVRLPEKPSHRAQ